MDASLATSDSPVRIPLTAADLRPLRGFDGRLLLPGDDGYDAARSPWNGMVDRHPALIARCGSAADVRAALRFARDRGLVVSIRGGGHNVAGNAVCEGGVMLDMSAMRSVEIDAGRGLVRAAAGAMLGDLDTATRPAHLAVPAGIVTTTGIAGLTLGGGIGWLMRAHGLTCDRLVGAALVTADGSEVRVSPTENPDLLWGLRGGGGNFGVVTEFTYEAVSLPGDVMAGILLYPMEDGERVLRAYRDWAATAPDDVTTILSLRTVLPLPTFPPELHGRRVISVGVVDAGDPGGAAARVEPLRHLGVPLLDLVGLRPFAAQQASSDASVPWGRRYYWKSELLDELSDGAIDALLAANRTSAQPWPYTIVFQLGGAVSRVAEEATAYSGRSARFAVNVNWIGERPGDDAAGIAWCRAAWEALRLHAPGKVYVNFLGDEGEERVREAYGHGAFDRLARLKAAWDPGNVFRLNQNVPPPPSGG